MEKSLIHFFKKKKRRKEENSSKERKTGLNSICVTNSLLFESRERHWGIITTLATAAG